MGIYLAEQTMLFFQSILLGALFGIAYDALRITRIAIPTARWVVSVEDVLYFLLCAVSAFFFIMRTNDGQVRLFVLIGATVGMLLYFNSLSILVMGVSEALIRFVKAVIRLICRWIFLPIWRLFYAIVSLIIRPIAYLGGLSKKTVQRCKNSLKNRREVLYNQLRSGLSRKATKPRPPKHGKRQRKSQADDKKHGKKEGRA
ncbi:MAG: spore cortex biosynthesis protein YabQ [Oscillospiraceae bacterium]|nr:spore cortex biosynthesis protein YabQ [Oscillospiraceae bacterium]